jgi:hypothetical protein
MATVESEAAPKELPLAKSRSEFLVPDSGRLTLVDQKKRLPARYQCSQGGRVGWIRIAAPRNVKVWPEQDQTSTITVA